MRFFFSVLNFLKKKSRQGDLLRWAGLVVEMQIPGLQAKAFLFNGSDVNTVLCNFL